MTLWLSNGTYLSEALHLTWQASIQTPCSETRSERAGLSHLKLAKATTKSIAVGKQLFNLRKFNQINNLFHYSYTHTE